MSTVRACGRDAAQLIGFAGRLLETWRGYSDAEADILAETMENGKPHAPQHRHAYPAL